MTQQTRSRQNTIREDGSRKTRATFALLTLLLAGIYICSVNHISVSNINLHMPTTHVQAQDIKIVSPLPVNKVEPTKYILPTATPIPTTVPTPKTESYNQISGKIKKIFGPDAPKAFKLLSCENGLLNPDAVNTAGNFPIGSRDIGVFQINEYWQKVNAKFLFNPDINILIANQIYNESGKSFKMWSCGRKLGI